MFCPLFPFRFLSELTGKIIPQVSTVTNSARCQKPEKYNQNELDFRETITCKSGVRYDIQMSETKDCLRENYTLTKYQKQKQCSETYKVVQSSESYARVTGNPRLILRRSAWYSLNFAIFLQEFYSMIQPFF